MMIAQPESQYENTFYFLNIVAMFKSSQSKHNNKYIQRLHIQNVHCVFDTHFIIQQVLTTLVLS